MIALCDDATPRLSYEEVAHELKRRLYLESGEPDASDEGQGAFLTLSYDQLYSLSGYHALHKRFYTDVEWYAGEIGIIIGFGYYGIIVATDDHFAASGWSSRQ